MFNLGQAISGWRRKMLTAGIKSPVPLEELEIHLRDEIERQMNEGLSAQQAFGRAIQQIGPPNALKNEFQKTNALNVEGKRTHAIAASILIVFVGLVLSWATVVQSRDMGKITGEVVMLLVLGLVLVFSGVTISILASKRSPLASKH